jgi:8-oxo-dGTP pyrophosphatase MutT (NUDIX family)
MPAARLPRLAARVILLSTDGRTLLFRGGDPGRPEAGTWWFTPGGGVEAGETTEQAARREVAEETGLECGEMGPVVMTRSTDFEFDGVVYEQTEDYFVVRSEPFVVDSSRWSAIEVATVEEHRWWSIEDLRETDDAVYPENLLELISRVQ